MNAHEPSEACSGTHCYWHHVDEPDDGAYRVCFECKHVYVTAEDLRQAWRDEVVPALREYGREAEPPPAEEIYACVFCCHDW